MDFITGILGLVVLSGPLWLIVLAVPVALFVAYKVAKGGKVVTSRIAAFASVLLACFLALFGDEIAGRMYLNHLCETEAGVKVYQTVELPAEYWDEQGRARFYDERNGNFYLSIDYPTELTIENNYSFFHIDKLVTSLRDKKKERVFAERISYMNWGGWMRRNFSPHNTATSCSNDTEQYGNLIKQAFKPARVK